MKFRKKLVVIEAVQFDGTEESLDTIVKELNIPLGAYRGYDKQGLFYIITSEGDHIAQAGDWIIKRVAGEFYPCKPGIFAQTYESVEEEVN